MNTGTKFWLAVGVSGAMFILAAIYLITIKDKADSTILGSMLGVITLVVGGYFTTNVVASGQAASVEKAKACPPEETKEG
jgi:hypothetical protein